MNKKKIYFYGPNDIIPAQKARHILTFFYNTVPLFLDSHVRYANPELHSQLEWTSLVLLKKTQDQLVSEIIDQKIDFLCLSLYIWNADELLECIRGIKKRIPDSVTVIAGGPSVDIFRDREFLHKNPDIDYAIYTQGEQAFLDILEHKINGRELNTLNTKNLAWVDPATNKLKISEFEFVRHNDGSPYLEAQDLLLRMRDDPAYKGFDLILPYETGRGCPYKCSFCDWTSGLTHKVSKRNFDYEEELDFLGRNGITFFQMSDANFGIQKRDIEIARTMVRLKKERGYNFRIHGNNFNKLKKDVVFEIVDLMMSANILMTPKFALQDIDPVVLKNIDRPDIPWPEHKAYIQEIEKKYPNVPIRLELIFGMPGQTIESWENTLTEIYPYELLIHPMMVLANSPIGYDMEYREKMGIKTLLTNLSTSFSGEYLVEIVHETYSFDINDYSYFLLLVFALKLNEFRLYPNRRALFTQVRNNVNFNSTIEFIKNCLLNKTCELIVPKVNTFIKEIL
jgi:hypothetical protein